MADLDLGKGWIAGTYGLKFPACVVTADAVVYRKRPDGEVEIVVAPARQLSGKEDGLYAQSADLLIRLTNPSSVPSNAK